MSGVNFNSTSYATRLTEIESALANPKSKKKINDSLELVSKENGFLRFLKIMVLPVARFFGTDPFGHTRAHKVATKLLAEYQKFEGELKAEDKARLSRILTTLDKKTKGRYKEILGIFIKMIPVDPTIAGTITPGAPTLPVGKIPAFPTNLPPPPTVTVNKDPRAALLEQIAKNKKRIGETTSDATTEEVSKVKETTPKGETNKKAAAGDVASELSALLKNGGVQLKKTESQKSVVVEERKETPTGNPWGVTLKKTAVE